MSNRKKIIEEASDWCMLIESDQATDEDISEFVAWLDLSPLHQHEYDSIRTVWSDSAGLTDIYQKDIDNLSGIKQPSVPFSIAGLQARFRENRVGFVASAAAAIIFLALGVGTLLSYVDSNDVSEGGVFTASHRTEKGESKRIRLSDGSFVHLNTQSDILVRFNNQERSILLQEGEAFFEVRKDPNRPFVVKSRGTAVTALGTKFSVESFPGADFAVTVTEGKVLLTHAFSDQQGQSPATLISQINLSVGESIRVNRSEPFTEKAIEIVDLDKALPWRTGKLLFDKKPLSRVVTDFNRYNEKVITIADPSLNDFLISGYFDAHDPDGFLGVVEKLIAVRAVAVSENEVKLLRRQD